MLCVCTIWTTCLTAFLECTYVPDQEAVELIKYEYTSRIDLSFVSQWLWQFLPDQTFPSCLFHHDDCFVSSKFGAFTFVSMCLHERFFVQKSKPKHFDYYRFKFHQAST